MPTSIKTETEPPSSAFMNTTKTNKILLHEPFNLDVIMEILSRSSLQTISKCRLLSKECNTLTYESFFRCLHSQRAKTVSGLFIDQFAGDAKFFSQFVSSDEQPALSLNFLPCGVRIMASTNIGILLCVNATPRIHEYYVCKPTTKQYRKLPNPKTRYFTVAIGMVMVKANPLCYKVVRISQPKFCRYYSDYCNYRTEIFDSKTWSWKQVNALSLHRDKFLLRRPAISVGGSLYWPTSDDKTIVAYHQQDNCCSRFVLPEKIVPGSRHIKLVECEGKLAVICDKGGLIELWMMTNNIGEEAWSRRLLSCEDVRKIDRFARSMKYYGSDVALFRGFSELIFYNTKNKNSHVVRMGSSSINIENSFQFQSDYELVNFYRGKR